VESGGKVAAWIWRIGVVELDFFAKKKPTPALRKGRHIKTKRKTNFLS